MTLKRERKEKIIIHCLNYRFSASGGADSKILVMPGLRLSCISLKVVIGPDVIKMRQWSQRKVIADSGTRASSAYRKLCQSEEG